MRWLVLMLSLGSVTAAIYRGIFQLFTYGSANSSLLNGVLLIAAAVIGLLGGIISFNRKWWGTVFLAVAAGVCFFGYKASSMYALYFGVVALLAPFVALGHRDDSWDDYDDDPDNEDEDDDEDAEIMRRTRRAYKTVTESRTDSVIARPKRARTTKVCIDCGIEVPKEFNFCFNCGHKFDGMEQHTDGDGGVESKPAGEINAEPAEAKDETPIVDQSTTVTETPADNAPDENVEKRDKGENRPKTEKHDVIVRKVSINDDDDDIEDTEAVRIPKIRVAAPVSRQEHEADASYQSFGRYAQSRKVRQSSIIKRILITCVMFALLAAVGWFVYSGVFTIPSEKVPQPEPPAKVVETLSDDAAKVKENKIVLAIPDGAAQLPSDAMLPFYAPQPPKSGYITGSNVNLRADHSTASKSLGRLPGKTTNEILGQWQAASAEELTGNDKKLTGVWYQIRSGNETGWIYGQYIQPLDGRDASLPAGYATVLANQFGTTQKQIEGKLGSARKVGARGKASVVEFSGLTATIQDNAVRTLRVTGKDIKLSNGISAGMSYGDVEKILGAPNTFKNNLLSYLEEGSGGRGIFIQLDNADKVRSITVGVQ